MTISERLTSIPEIFVSYRRSDSGGHARALNRDLCRRFSDENIFFDRSSIESGDIFPEQLEKGVNECKVLLALIGPDWLEVKNATGERSLEDPNDIVRQEISRALRLGKKVIPVLFDDTPMPPMDCLPEPLKALAHCDALTLGGKNYEYDTQLEELIRLLAKVPGVPKPKPDEKGVRDKFVRFAEDLLSDHFTGRTRELNSVSEALPLDDSSLRTDQVVLYGMGGGGKTQIALKWIDGHQEDYTGIWWLRSERSEILEADLEEFCLQCNVPRSQNEPPLTAIVRWLARQSRWMLVFDNADDKEQLRPYIKPFMEQKNLGRHHLIITSRNPHWAGIATPIEVSPWKGEVGLYEALTFLQSRLPEVDKNEIGGLAEQLGGLPLALEQAASFIEETGMPVSEYLDMLASVDTAGILLEEGRPATGYERNVVAALSLSIERLSPAALQLLPAVLPAQSDDPAVWPTGLSLLTHIQTLALFSKDEEVDPELIVNTLNRETVLALNAGLPGHGESLARNARQIGSRFLGEEHSDTLKSMNNLAATLYGRAISLHLENCTSKSLKSAAALWEENTRIQPSLHLTCL